MTNSKQQSSENENSCSNRNHHRLVNLLKAKSKSSINISCSIDGNDHRKHLYCITPNNQRTKESDTRPLSSKACSKLKKILMFGNIQHQQNACSAFSGLNFVANYEDSEPANTTTVNNCGSISDVESEILDFSSSISRSFRSLKHQYVDDSESPVKVIKPTAIRPSVMKNYDPPRSPPRSSSLSLNTSNSPESLINVIPNHMRYSAFHQVLQQHCRSDSSLSEPSSSPNNPYSNPISMENIDDDKEDDFNLQQENDSSEPIHMTLEEVRRIAFGSPERRLKKDSAQKFYEENKITLEINQRANTKSKIKNLFDNLLNKTPCIGTIGCTNDQYISSPVENVQKEMGIWRSSESKKKGSRKSGSTEEKSPFTCRALPPVPGTSVDHNNNDNNNLIKSNSRRHRSPVEMISQSQFKSMSEYERHKYEAYINSIESVKNCGWYWGPMSGEMAEKFLGQEPCGSFLVRDSSDERYIFSLSFKLDGMVRHVRIEQDQGNFSFGALKKFRSSTIVDFIESAMEHSRSGQFLFFLRLGPELGPLRVQLLHPVSRFRRVQSLQHICRFVILQYVRRDQIPGLALPENLRHYLSSPYYYSEELAQMLQEAEEERLIELRRKLTQQQSNQDSSKSPVADVSSEDLEVSNRNT